MDSRTKELIAVGASIAANCQPCLQYHVGKARENGADDEEIRMAIAVGKTVRQGAALKMDRFATTVSDECGGSGAPSGSCSGSADSNDSDNSECQLG